MAIWAKFHDLGVAAFVLVSLSCALNIYFILGQAVLFSSGNFKWWSILQILNSFLVVLLISISWLKSISQDPVYAFSISVSVLLIIVIVSAFLIRKHVDFRASISDLELTKKLLLFSSKNLANNFVWMLGARIDLYIVGALLSPASLGIYSLSTGLADKLQNILMILPQSLYPSQASGKNDNKNVELTTARAIRLSLTLGMILALCLIIIVPIILPSLFGEGYSGAIFPFKILVINSVLFTSFHFFGGYLTGRKLQPEISAFFGAVMVIVNFIGNIILIPKIDILGAATANLFSTIAVLIPMGLYYSKSTQVPLSKLFMIEKNDVNDFLIILNRVFKEKLPSIFKK